MDARFMQMHNFVLTREIIINSIFPVDRMRELNFHRETAVWAWPKNAVTLRERKEGKRRAAVTNVY